MINIDRFVSILIRFRWMMVLLSVIVMATAFSGFKYFFFDSSPRIYFEDGHQGYERFLDMEDTYGRDFKVFIMLSAKQGDMFDLDNIQALKSLTEESWTKPFVSRVDSLANYQVTMAQNDELLVEDLLGDNVIVDPVLLEQRKQLALQDRDILDRLISRDGKAASILIRTTMDGPESQSPEGVAMVDGIYEMADRIAAAHPDIEIHVSGNLISTYQNMKVATSDMRLMIPVMFILMFVLLGVLLRSVSTIFITLAVAICSTIGAVGMVSLLGVTFSVLAINSLMICITIAVAHCIHIFTQFFKELAHSSKREALQKSLSKNFVAVSMTSFTTVIGFLSLNTNDLPPAAALGNSAAMGAALAWLFSLTLLPAMVMLLPFKPHKTGNFWLESKMAALAEILIERRNTVFVVMILSACVMMGLALQNQMNDRLTEMLHKPHIFRSANDAIDKHFGAVYTNNYDLDSGEENGIADPEYLKNLDKFSEWLRSQPEVRSVYSFADIVKRLNQTMHNDDPAYYRIPDNRELIAQYILLYEMSLPFGLDLNERVTTDKSKTLLTVSMPSMDTDGSIDMDRRTDRWIKENLPEQLWAENISMSTIWSHLTLNSVKNSLEGALIALTLISAVLLFVLRSVRYGLISLVPNLMPVIFGFGLWYLYSGYIGLGLSCVVILTIGIVVDDTVHFLVKYKQALHETGNAADAIRATCKQVGPALAITTMVLASGFSVLALSQIIMNSALGQMTSAILIAALILDLLLLPVLLLMSDGKKKALAVEGNNNGEYAAASQS